MCPGPCLDYAFDIKLENSVLYGYGIRVDVGNGRTWLVTQTFPFGWRVARYYHVVAAASTTGLVVYVDGVSIGSSAYEATPFLYGRKRRPQIGVSNATGGVEWFHGLIDEVAVYDYALTAEQVAQHYAAGIGP